MITRRRLMQYGAGAGAGLVMWRFAGGRVWAHPLGTSVLDATAIPQYATSLVIPPAMPRSGKSHSKKGQVVDYYRIGVRQFKQEILPAAMGLGPTKVWSYGSVDHPQTFNYPAFTIEAAWRKPVRVKWINELVSGQVPAAPASRRPDAPLGEPAGWDPRARRPRRSGPYRGPVPIVTHLHGGHSDQQSDGYPEAWYLPKARQIPHRYAQVGSKYQEFRALAQAELGQAWTPGSAVFQYDNDQRDDDVVPRPHPGADPRQRLRRAGRLLPAARRADDAVGETLPGPAPSAIRRARVLRDPDRDPGPLLHRRGRALLPRQPRVFRGARSAAADPFWGAAAAAARATSRRSGTRSSSATRWWSTGEPGRSWRCSGATASAS